MMFDKKVGAGGYQIVREAGEDVMYINYNEVNRFPSVEDDPLCMLRTIENLIREQGVSRIIFNQHKNYVYEYDQVNILLEIANLYSHLMRQRDVLGIQFVGRNAGLRRANIQYVVFNLLRSDPIGAYVESMRFLREGKIVYKRILDRNEKDDQGRYLSVLEEAKNLLEKTRLISLVKEQISGYTIGDRSLYKNVFKALIMPDFMYTRLMSRLPINGEQLDMYSVGENDINIFRLPDEIKNYYHITPPEFKISEDKQELLNLARLVLAEHKPGEEEFLDPDKMRSTFFNIGRDLLMELAETKGYDIKYNEIEELARILVRHTVGFGLIEALLQDKKVQDIAVNGPIGQTRIFLTHEDYDECVTNIIPSQDDAESWATKFRLLSGRPLDEANPVLDTELILPGSRNRVAIIGQPLNPWGLGYAFRRHRDKPWTLPLFINNKMISSLGAGLMSFLVDGSRSILVAGTRGSGKCVDGNTLIQLSDGSIRKIKNLIGKKKRKIDDGFIYEPVSNLKVNSLQGMDISSKKMTDVWKRDSPEKVVKIKTRCGKEIITTQEHPYFIYNSGLKNMRADELKKGDLIASPRILKTFGKDIFINLKDIPELVSETEDYFILKGKTNSLTLKFPKRVTEKLAEFIGLIVGDGHLDKHKLEFHNSCKEMRERYISLIEMFDIPYRVFKSHTTTVVQISCRILNKVLNQIFGIPFGKKSDKVVIPQFILKSKNNVLASFLRGYFDTDGYVDKNKREIELVSASKDMSDYLKLALLRFGINLFVLPKKINGVNYYRNVIYSDCLKKFGESIGFYHPKKQDRLNEKLMEKYIKNTNVDIIPDGNKIFKRLRKILRVSPKELKAFGKDYWAHETGEYRMSRNWFKKFISFYKERFNSLVSMKNQINLLRKFIDFDCYDYFNKVENLRKVLGLSYLSLSNDLGLSDRGLRNILQNNKIGKFQTFKKIVLVNDIFENRIKELSSLRNVEMSVKNLPVFVKKGIVSYAGVSRNLKIPETTLKYYCSSSNVPEKKKILIESKLDKIKAELLLNIKNSSGLIREISSGSFISNCINVGVILSNFRNMFNISNEEFALNNISLGTVTNFFIGKYNTSNFRVLRSMIKTIVNIYDSMNCEEVSNLLLEAEKLANSDIFWDEIFSIELIDKVDDFVYDLTIEDTHNFVANGLIAHNTSFLGSCLLEIMRKYRLITVEDTLELSTEAMRRLGYNIQPMKVRSALMTGGTEVAADEGIRTSLRLGDSALIVGEIRSKEALALFEAMRVGALANVVAGTIHGESPYGVFDRVVNDLKVPRTSFKAADIILVCNPVKSSDGLHKWRRVQQITEVRKHWEEDPLREKGFVDLMKYNPETDLLEPTDELINGESEVLKNIAGNIKEWAGNWDAIWDNVLLRAKVNEKLVEYANKSKNMDLLEAEFVLRSKDYFYRVSESVREEVGNLDTKKILFEWEDWLKRELKKRRIG